uniref:Uncharacterized protein n=1 Tax=Siphoviridae sp. ct91l7 TaxID=2826173 RepID=A0A8S5MWT8_9CAUD|nr:MAG TPA: hypothetical protein [Siphoviridae sp. ct91l7]
MTAGLWRGICWMVYRMTGLQRSIRRGTPMRR